MSAGGTYTPGTNEVEGGTVLNNYGNWSYIFDASKGSSIYKNNVSQVFGDSLSYNLYIKAKQLFV